jgi:restriction system protein
MDGAAKAQRSRRGRCAGAFDASTETALLLSKRIVLIDGEQLAKLMIRHNVGCRVEDTLHIKKIDEDFFD